MARILILANNDVGLYKFRKELIEELLRIHEVYVSLPNGDFVSNLIELGCKFINTPISRRGTNPISDLKLLLNYKKMIKAVNPDVVLTYTIKPNIYGGLTCRLSNIPYIANITGLGTAVENKGILQKVTLILYRQALIKASCVFFQNSENKEFFMRNKVIKAKNRLIPGSGVNLDHYTVMDYPSDEKINFLFVARVMKEKGIDQFIDAAKYFSSKKKPRVSFHVLGFCEQDYYSKLIKLQNSGVIEYHGMQSDVRKFYKSSHCIIHPTYYPEGMSNVLLEGAASGRPIITTNRSGCREIIDDGVNGYIVEQKNSQDLIEKIERFLDLDHEIKKQMGLASRKKVEKEFDRRLVVGSYLEELGKLVN